MNGAPLDLTVTWEHADDLREQVAPELFRHLDVDRFPSSILHAVALANSAYRTDLQVGERVGFALRDALFEEGRDISDRATLESLASDLGIVMPDESDRTGVLADWREGVRRGVLGSPHFFYGDTDVFCPSLDITKDPTEGVSIVMDASRPEGFPGGLPVSTGMSRGPKMLIVVVGLIPPTLTVRTDGASATPPCAPRIPSAVSVEGRAYP